MRVMDNPQLPHRAIKIVEEHRLCVVEGCMVRSRVLDEWGMCPSELWDWRHEEYADNAHRVREGISTEKGGPTVGR